jgi:hypothetical protein
MEPRYAVDPSTVIEKLKSRIADEAYNRALAESAVDQLLAQNIQLQGQLSEVQLENRELRQNTELEIQELRSEIEELGKPQHDYQVVSSPE